ncbi:MAG: hypothetical protein RR906_04150 [Acetivibrio sp.]
MKEAKETFWDLLIGIVFYTLLVSVAGAVLVDSKLTFVSGVVYGAVISGILAYHMFYSIERTLDFDPSGAEKYARKMFAIRTFIMIAAIVAAIFLPALFHIIGVILGMMALKMAAYLQPFIRSYITTKIYNKGR